VQLDIISIINNGSNDFIIKMQQKYPLKIVGFSNVKYDERGALKFSIYFYCKECKQEILMAHNIDPAFMNHFKIGSILFKDKIIESEKLFPLIFEINFDKTEAIPFRGFNFDTQYFFFRTDYGLLIKNAYNYFENTYITKTTYKDINIYIPTFLIGKYFYFPNSRIKEAFQYQNMEQLYYPVYSNCDEKKFVLKTRTGQHNDTIKLICLYHCNEYARNMFYKLSAMIKNEPVPNCFSFPLKGKTTVKLLGKFLKDPDTNQLHFIAYDLIDVSLKNICGEDILFIYG
jgi:hypothetical protein